jgi:hypothetical protein
VTATKKYEHDAALLATALDHATRWYDFRTSAGLQVLNFFLLASAVLSTAYVSAINGRLHVVAVAIAVVGAAVSCGTYLVGRRLRDDARFSELPIMEIEDRLAAGLNMESLRMVKRSIDHRKIWWHNATTIANIMFPLIIAGCIAAATYAWFVR